MRTKTIFHVAMTCVLVLLVSQSAAAQRRGNWEYLGEANVDGMGDHDTIRVGRDDGRFRTLQLRVERAPIEFQRVVVRYGNGETEKLPVRNRIRAGGATRNIDLRGRDRVVESVDIWYARASYDSAKPKVRLYGR